MLCYTFVTLALATFAMAAPLNLAQGGHLKQSNVVRDEPDYGRLVIRTVDGSARENTAGLRDADGAAAIAGAGDAVAIAGDAVAVAGAGGAAAIAGADGAAAIAGTAELR